MSDESEKFVKQVRNRETKEAKKSLIRILREKIANRIRNIND